MQENQVIGQKLLLKSSISFEPNLNANEHI